MSNTLYPGPTATDLAAIPDALKALPQWMLWRASDRLDKQTGAVVGLKKVPYTTDPDKKADPSDPRTWKSFDECVAALPVALEDWALADPASYRGGGIGFVFTEKDGFCGIDADHSVAPDGTIAPWAQAIVKDLDSYTQRSCSGTGLHVIIEGKLPPGRCQDGDLQMWDERRFFAMTGWHLPGTPRTVEHRQGPLETLWCAHFGAQVGDLVECIDANGTYTTPQPVAIERLEAAPDGQPFAFFSHTPTGWPLAWCVAVPVLASGVVVSPPMADDVILQKAMAAANGQKFSRLWDGDWTGYTSQSEADLALCMMLAFYTQAGEQINRLFEQSRLYRTEKWSKRFDYRRRTIDKALSGCSAFYQPPALGSLTVNGSQNGTTPGIDAAALAQQLYDDLLALPEDQRTPDALFQHAVDLATMDAADLAMWKQRFKALLGRRLSLADLNALLKTAIQQATKQQRRARQQARTAADPRPTILFNPEVTRYTEKGQEALLALPDAPIYQRARRLSIITYGGTAPSWLHRPPDMASIALLTTDHLRELAGQAARWEAEGPEERYEITPPDLFCQTLMARPSWPFPVLEGVIHAPTLRPDGSVLDQPGYDESTGLFYDPGHTSFPPISAAPDIFEANCALNALKDALCDFLFVHDYDLSAALAAALSMACRFAVMGCVPLFAVTAPVRGSGKSYLVDTLSIIGTGRSAPRWPQVMDPDEERKRLLAVALAGYSAIHIDNVSRPLGSPALDLALTSSSFSDRILGQTASVEAPLNMVWLASGNNMQYAGDTARRVMPIVIDPAMEKPEERSGFKHEPLIPWVQANRPHLTIAALTVVKAYFEAGKPPQGLAPYGSFEAWSDLIRQALVWCGEADPCLGRADIEATNNPEYETYATLLLCWRQCYGNTPKTLKQVFIDVGFHAGPLPQGTSLTIWHEFQGALGACDSRFDGKRLDARRIGNAFRQWQGRYINGLRLVAAGKDRQGVVEWRVE